jgi:hypothetical protein
MITNNGRGLSLSAIFQKFHIRRGLIFGMLIIAALLAFEAFNYSTTEFALTDLLGNLKFASIRWATILAIAFCGIDFAGIARLFTPEQGADEPTEVWYLFGAWLLAATMNAMLTWWGVSIAILNHNTLGNPVISQQTLLRVVPIFVAIMVWLIRVLIIGTFSVAGDRLFSEADRRVRPQATQLRSLSSRPVSTGRPLTSATPSAYRPAPKLSTPPESTFVRPEPTYHPVGMNASTTNAGNPQTRR